MIVKKNLKMTMTKELEDIIDTGEIEEERTSSGHSFRFAFSVCDLIDVQPYTFKQDIKTKCDVLPTSWSLELVFNQELDSSIISCNLTAKRTDSLNDVVKADIEITYSFVEYADVDKQQLHRYEYSPGQEITGHCSNILPFPEEIQKYLDGGISVEVTLSVACCPTV